MKIGIDLGGSHIAVGIVTSAGKILRKEEKDIIMQYEEEKIKQYLVDNILEMINAAIRNAEIPVFVIEEIGIGVPGIVEKNIIKKCDKYKIKDWDLAKIIEEHYSIPVKLENDAVCAAKAEKEYGNLKDDKDAVFICIGTGIGSAIIKNGEIYASEIGHMIIEKGGRECNCKNKGCFETYSSMKVFKKELIEILGINQNATSKEILETLIKNKENEKINEYINRYTETLCIGLANIINILKPRKICIGGGFTYFEDILYKRLLEKIQLISYRFEKPQIVLAKLQNDAGIIGAVPN